MKTRLAAALRTGVTLAELIVALAILGLMAGVVGLAVRTPHPLRAIDAATALAIAARDSAVRSGHVVTVEVRISDGVRLATALPDGRIVADSGLVIDPLSGRALHAER